MFWHLFFFLKLKIGIFKCSIIFSCNRKKSNGVIYLFIFALEFTKASNILYRLQELLCLQQFAFETDVQYVFSASVRFKTASSPLCKWSKLAEISPVPDTCCVSRICSEMCWTHEFPQNIFSWLINIWKSDINNSGWRYPNENLLST